MDCGFIVVRDPLFLSFSSLILVFRWFHQGACKIKSETAANAAAVPSSWVDQARMINNRDVDDEEEEYKNREGSENIVQAPMISMTYCYHTGHGHRSLLLLLFWRGEPTLKNKNSSFCAAAWFTLLRASSPVEHNTQQRFSLIFV